MFIVVRNDSEVLAALDPFAPMAWTWIDYGLSVATDHRYAVPFETRHGAENCAGIHGAQVHTIGDWDDETERSRSADGGTVGHRGPAGKAGRCTECEGRAAAPDGAGRPERALQARPAGRRDPRRAGGRPYLSHFRVVVNKFGGM